MTTYRTEIDSPRERDEVFEYLATFSNASEWDPGVTEAEPLTPGPPELGSVYRLRVRVAGRTVPFDYRVVAIDRPTRVVLQAQASGMVSTDTITVEPAGAGSQVRYVAVLEGRGVLRLAAPVIARSFRKMADRGADGLRRALA
jgi:carbon monoxide dehydrogenase subunit G